MQKVYKYNLQVKHDTGSKWITTYATSKKAAIQMIMTFENCPRRAIINVNRA